VLVSLTVITALGNIYTTLNCIRSKAFGLFVSVNWGSNLIISSLTLTAIELLGGGASGVAYLYLIFAAVSACAVAFVHACVHETMGRSLEELQMSTSRSSSATGAAASTAADYDEFDVHSSIAATAYRPLAAQSGCSEEDDFDRHLQDEHV
jgi:Sugar (and other) transporter